METIDRQQQVYEDWNGKLRARLRPLVTDHLIAEHRRDPLGHHSDELARLLTYLRREPVGGRYVIVVVEPWREYRIGVLSEDRGTPARIFDEHAFATEEEAVHGIFLLRVRDLMEAADGQA